MGSWKPFSFGSSYESNPINPNPSNFKIKRSEKVGSFWVSEIHYPNCINFEGNKILVTEWNPRDRTYIDPHFELGNGLIVRVEPTNKGWNWALKFCEILND